MQAIESSRAIPSEYGQCAGCHSVDANGLSGYGPNLFGLMGREIGSVTNFLYSDAMANSKVIWTQDTLDEFLRNPMEFIPGTSMMSGIVVEDDARAAIILYLQSLE